jgi:hypothetical protein
MPSLWDCGHLIPLPYFQLCRNPMANKARIPSIEAGQADPMGVVLHHTEQHMVTYRLFATQLDSIGTAGARFTVLTALASSLLSATVTCALAGLTVPHNTWDAPQTTVFLAVPIITGVLTLVAGWLAYMEFQIRGKEVNLIKANSYEPGTVKTLSDLMVVSDKTVQRQEK